ncbi:MAG: phosphopantothenoylcysteine decarboxylase [Opitutales bacterium]
MKARPIRCLITAGPTREFLDPVRFLSNPSSGKMGFALAQAAVSAGWHVQLVHGPVALEVPPGVEAAAVVSAEEMCTAVQARFQSCDILIKTAAVCDMRPRERFGSKQKKEALQLTVAFERTPDILKTVAAQKGPHQVVVGFAAETDQVEHHARLKLEAKNLDWIVANQVGQAGSGFEADANAVILLGRDGSRQAFGPASKADIAHALINFLKEPVHAVTTQHTS